MDSTLNPRVAVFLHHQIDDVAIEGIRQVVSVWHQSLFQHMKFDWDIDFSTQGDCCLEISLKTRQTPSLRMAVERLQTKLKDRSDLVRATALVDVLGERF